MPLWLLGKELLRPNQARNTLLETPLAKTVAVRQLVARAPAVHAGNYDALHAACADVRGPLSRAASVSAAQQTLVAHGIWDVSTPQMDHHVSALFEAKGGQSPIRALSCQ